MRNVLSLAALLAVWSCTTPTKPILPYHRSAWITLEFGAGVQPTKVTSEMPPDWNGSMCDTLSLAVENHPTRYAGFTAGDELVGTNNCEANIDIAYCVTTASDINDSDIPTCASDPRWTATGNLRLATLVASTPRTHHLLGHTPASINVTVFWCSSKSQLNLGKRADINPAECVVKD
jgi:hypothetical protein